MSVWAHRWVHRWVHGWVHGRVCGREHWREHWWPLHLRMHLRMHWWVRHWWVQRAAASAREHQLRQHRDGLERHRACRARGGAARGEVCVAWCHAPASLRPRRLRALTVPRAEQCAGTGSARTRNARRPLCRSIFCSVAPSLFRSIARSLALVAAVVPTGRSACSRRRRRRRGGRTPRVAASARPRRTAGTPGESEPSGFLSASLRGRTWAARGTRPCGCTPGTPWRRVAVAPTPCSTRAGEEIHDRGERGVRGG